MKTIKQLLLIIVATIATTSFAQNSYLENPNWGENPEDREANVLTFNLFRNAVNAEDIPSAVGFLNELLVKSPKGTENIFILGMRIYDDKVVRATSLTEKKLLLDTLMNLYDQRAINFGSSAKSIGLAAIKENKAKAYYKYNPTDFEGVQKCFHEAIVAGGDKVDLRLINSYFKTVADSYMIDMIEADDLIEDYNTLVTIFDNSTDVNAAKEKATFESLFLNSGVANCENLETMFKDKLAAHPDSVELLNKVFNLLTGSSCESDFYYDLAEKLYAVNPSSKIALQLASKYQDEKNLPQALKYLNEAAANETDPTAKSNLYINIGGTELALKNLVSAVKYANMALELSPENAYAHIIIGTAYIQGSESCTDFKLKTVYWLAHDTFMKARRNLAEDDPQMANAKTQINACSVNFPTTEECFFLGLNEGSPYTVECGWIKKETTVRYRK